MHKYFNSLLFIFCFCFSSCHHAENKKNRVLTNIHINSLLINSKHTQKEKSRLKQKIEYSTSDEASIEGILDLLSNPYKLDIKDSLYRSMLFELNAYCNNKKYPCNALKSALLLQYNDRNSPKNTDSLLQSYLDLSHRNRCEALETFILLKMADQFSSHNDNLKAYTTAQQSYRLAKKINNQEFQIESLRKISIYSSGIDNVVAIGAATELINIANKNHDSLTLLSGYTFLSNIYLNDSKPKKSLSNILHAIELSKLLHDSSTYQSSITSLINIYLQLNDTKQASHWLEKLKTFQTNQAYYYNIQLQILFKQNKYAEAIALCDSLLKHYPTNQNASSEKPDEQLTPSFYFDLCILKTKALLILNQYEQSAEIMRSTNQFIKSHPIVFNELNRNEWHTLEAKIHIHHKKYREAIHSLNASIQDLSPMLKHFLIVEYHQLSSAVYDSLKDYKNAYYHKNKFYEMSGLLQEKENNIKFQEIEDDYKQRELELENKRREDIAQIKLNKEKLKRNVFISLSLLLFLFASLALFAYLQKKKDNLALNIEKQKSESLLLNILPSEIAEELKATGDSAPKQFDEVTVMFTDFKNFTQFSESLSPKELVDELNVCFKAFDQIIARYNIEKIKTMGDGFIAASGLPVKDDAHAANMVKAALEIRDFMIERKKQLGHKTFEIRIGLHSGKVVAGIVGVKKYAYDIWGDTVNTAARMEQSGEAGQVNISETTYELVKNDFQFTYRGELEAKNKGKIKMYFVVA